MKDIILKYIIEKFGETENIGRHEHFSYCPFPENECCCKRLPKIEYDTPLISGGFVDSFSMVGVLMFLEKTFNVKIPEKKAIPYNFDSVNAMASLINDCKK